ncbi:MAG: hypothetical protein IJ251_03935 [Oscillospiraceae bacterium]|nr:hypothetical protein [Oscillospiraceae bacterium]
MENMNNNLNMNGDKKVYVASIVLGILGLIIGVVLIPVLGVILGGIGIGLAVKHMSTHKAVPGLVCSILGVVGSVAM